MSAVLSRRAAIILTLCGVPSLAFAEAGQNEPSATVAQRTALLLTMAANNSKDLGIYFAQKDVSREEFIAWCDIDHNETAIGDYFDNNIMWGDALMDAFARGSIALTEPQAQDLQNYRRASAAERMLAYNPKMFDFPSFWPEGVDPLITGNILRAAQILQEAGDSFLSSSSDQQQAMFEAYCNRTGVSDDNPGLRDDKVFVALFDDYVNVLQVTRTALIYVVEAGTTNSAGPLATQLAGYLQDFDAIVEHARVYANTKRYTNSMDAELFPPRRPGSSSLCNYSAG